MSFIRIKLQDATKAIKEFIPWLSTNGRAHVRSIGGTGAIIKNRELDLAATYARATNGTSWTSTDNVTEIYVTVFADAAALEVAGGAAGDYGAPQVEKHATLVLDAGTEAIANSWLSQAASTTLNSQKIPIPYGQRIGPFIAPAGEFFTNVDIATDVAATAYVEAQ